MDLEFLIPITLFGVTFGVIYTYFKTRHIERLKLIEKGADASLFENKSKGNYVLKIGMLLIGVSIGILMGSIIESNTNLQEEAYFSMIFLFAGIALVASNYMEKNDQK